MTVSDEVSDVVASVLVPLGLELVDLQVSSGLVRVTVDRPGGVDLDTLAEANRVVSRALDELDPVAGRYRLEVSSPGVERPLRTPAQYARALGETVLVRLHPGAGATRRMQGTLSGADETGFTLEADDLPDGSVRLDYGAVERARTVFEWGAAPAPSPSRGRPGPGGRGGRPTNHATTERVTTP
jgi:ribosome maturation factor RimP